MSFIKLVLLAMGVLVLVGVVVMAVVGGFLTSIFTNSYEIKNGRVFYHAAGIGLSEVEGADAATFKPMRKGNHGYGEDKNGIYFHEKRIQGADRDSFTILTGGAYWSKDKGAVFYGASALPGVDASKFRLLGPNYGTDGRSVYGIGRLLEGADPETFEVVTKDGTMAKDKNAWYRLEERGRMENGVFISDAEAAEEAAERTR
ncbi:DKNYY domain-containing protein [Pyxidicoccus sp. 3LFB2]